MKRMNLRDVPDDVYDKLAQAAAEGRQSLNAFVVGLLEDAVKVVDYEGYFASYTPPTGTGITSEDAVEAVRRVRDARDAS